MSRDSTRYMVRLHVDPTLIHVGTLVIQYAFLTLREHLQHGTMERRQTILPYNVNISFKLVLL